MSTGPSAFVLSVSDAAIGDLKDRLERTRYPARMAGEPWAYGTDVDYLKGLVDHWCDGFDWRRQEAALNAFPQFVMPVAGEDVHFIHARGAGPAPTPLLLLHGWPGSVFEFLDVIPRLTDPARFGGDPRDAFTVVAPSLPGFPLSFDPGQRRFGLIEMADALADLMRVLGYERFGVQGGDFGAGVAIRLAYAHADRIVGAHVNLLMAVGRDPADFPEPSEEERQYLRQLSAWTREEVGYQWIQGTRPQTLATGLTDSPAGLAAWMVEKFHAWSDGSAPFERRIDRERMLANISLYWFTGAIGSSFWPYFANRHGPSLIPKGEMVDVPLGYAEFPAEVVRPPRSVAARVFGDIRRWSVMPRGGHFAALEQPELLAGEIAAFFRDL